jgi:hypothetical protein
MDSERFWGKVNKNGPVPEHRPELGPCWVWTGATSKGYGIASRSTRAHRMALSLSGIPLEVGKVCDHLCRNRCCVNPEHIEQDHSKGER